MEKVKMGKQTIDEIRNRLNFFINYTGATQLSIARAIGISNTSLKEFRQGKRRLSSVKLYCLDEYLKSRKY